MADRAAVEGHIRSWLEQFVVGLNLCPFARPLLTAEALRIAITDDTDRAQLRRFFLLELDRLQGSSEEEIATTLLVFSAALADFADHLDFLDEARDLLHAAGLEGLVQLASFHPHYLFAGEHRTAASHYSNRSPWPVIHLIREDMLERVLRDYPDPQSIPDTNIATLQAIGREEIERRWSALFS
jgi:hypothetical protein